MLRTAAILMFLLLSPFLYQGFAASLPYVNGFASVVAVWCAGLNMPEGGEKLLESEISQKSISSYDDDISLQVDSPAFSTGSSSSVSSQSSETSSSESSSSSEEQKPANAGPIVREQFLGSASSTVFTSSIGGWIKNLTKHSVDEIQSQISQGPAFSFQNTSDPQVLIMHTHTTEGYESTTRDWYDPAYNSRTTDKSQSVVRVGDEIAKQLEAAGIGVIHDSTLHDYPNFPGCYDRSAVTIKNYLAKYPSIKVVLDVHRDAIERSDGTRVAPVANVNGKNAAQVMIISGCDDGTMNYPNYFLNLRFASLLQSQMEKDYPGFARPLLFDYRKYNQHLTSGSILLEMGSHANSLEEVIYAGELVGKSLSNALKTITK